MLEPAPYGYCQRCQQRKVLTALRSDGQMPGLKVCADCWDPKHPQEMVRAVPERLVLHKPSPPPADVFVDPEDINPLA